MNEIHLNIIIFIAFSFGAFTVIATEILIIYSFILKNIEGKNHKHFGRYEMKIFTWRIVSACDMGVVIIIADTKEKAIEILKSNAQKNDWHIDISLPVSFDTNNRFPVTQLNYDSTDAAIVVVNGKAFNYGATA